MAINNRITTGKVLGYFFMPRILPRVKNLFVSGFGYIPFLMAQVYAMVRLLPPAHPYLDPRNIGRFGIRHVIGEAANRLVLKKENFDQITIFIALLAGVILLALQIAAIVYSFIVQPVFAQAGGLPTSIFNTPNPKKDIALTLMDRVFGIPKLTCNTENICPEINASLPFPFHVGLHAMLEFYSLGILLVGVLIFLYYVVIVVGETASSGSPFGQRFANIWVPIRLVTAIGLLLPLNYGLNSAQYITLYAAKFGSGLATNGWIQFNRALADPTNSFNGDGYDDKRDSVFPGQNINENEVSDDKFTPLGEKETLIAKPEAPDVSPMVQLMGLVHACTYAHWKQDKDYGDKNNRPPQDNNFYIKPYFIKQPYEWMKNKEAFMEVTQGTTYQQGLDFYNNGDIIIRFGEHKDKYKNERGNVYPTCGEIQIKVSALKGEGQGQDQGGPVKMQEFYYKTVQRMWFDDQTLRDLSHRYIEFNSAINPEPCKVGNLPGECENAAPPGEIKQQLVSKYQTQLGEQLQTIWDEYRKEGAHIGLEQKIFERGWGGAGIWYNTVARVNGGFIDGVTNIPTTGQDGMPAIMREVRDRKSEQDTSVTGPDIYCPTLSNGVVVPGLVDDNRKIAQGLCDYLKYWNKDDANQASNERVPTGNAFTDAMMFVFGQEGLFKMREENASIHPLAQLAALGKGLVDSAVFNIGGSTLFAFGGGIAGALGHQKTASGLEIASSALNSVAFLGLTAGFVLFYVLPFMPFIYFFSAVATWIKSIFEAMVGVPLWALAHLRLDGEGLPGDSAANGYFLIFEIFVRPILSVFGLIAAMVIFTAQVRVLHFIWVLVLDNLSGFQGEATSDYGGQLLDRGVIDKFFFTIIYAVIVYMLATASFKLIDKIPDGILRWMGSPVSAFSDTDKDNFDQVSRYAAFGGISVGREAIEGVRGGSRTFGEGVGGMLNAVKNIGKSGGGA